MSASAPKEEPVAWIAGLWRYPVKGMHGESMEALEIDAAGVAGDRRYAFESSGAPAGKPLLTGRERAAMLLHRASTVNGHTVVETPDGKVFAVDDPALITAMEAGMSQGHRLTLLKAEQPFTDCRPIALLSLQTLAVLSEEYGSPVDARRFRANIVLHCAEAGQPGSPMPEDALVGRRVRIGDTVELHITERDPRCRIVTLDPQTAESDPALMKLLDRNHQGKAGIYAVTRVAGHVFVGDPVCLLPD